MLKPCNVLQGDPNVQPQQLNRDLRKRLAAQNRNAWTVVALRIAKPIAVSVWGVRMTIPLARYVCVV